MSARDYTEIFKRKPQVNFEDLKPGMILKFDPGAHTTKPYYVQVLKIPYAFASDIILHIPGRRIAKIDPFSWEAYHCKRATIIGLPTPENLALLHNQTIE